MRLSLPGSPMSVAVCSKISFTFHAERSRFADSMSAATPAIWGLENELPAVVNLARVFGSMTSATFPPAVFPGIVPAGYMYLKKSSEAARLISAAVRLAATALTIQSGRNSMEPPNQSTR